MSTGVNHKDPYHKTGNNTLVQLQDTTVTEPVPNGAGIIWNSTTNKWESGPLPGGGATELNDLSDVNQTPPVVQPTGTGTLSYNPSTLNYEYEHIPTSLQTGSALFSSEIVVGTGLGQAAVNEQILFFPAQPGFLLTVATATQLTIANTQMGQIIQPVLDSIQVGDVITISGAILGGNIMGSLEFLVTAKALVGNGTEYQVQASKPSPFGILQAPEPVGVNIYPKTRTLNELSDVNQTGPVPAIPGVGTLNWDGVSEYNYATVPAVDRTGAGVFISLAVFDATPATFLANTIYFTPGVLDIIPNTMSQSVTSTLRVSHTQSAFNFQKHLDSIVTGDFLMLTGRHLGVSNTIIFRVTAVTPLGSGVVYTVESANPAVTENISNGEQVSWNHIPVRQISGSFAMLEFTGETGNVTNANQYGTVDTSAFVNGTWVEMPTPSGFTAGQIRSAAHGSVEISGTQRFKVNQSGTYSVKMNVCGYSVDQNDRNVEFRLAESPDDVTYDVGGIVDNFGNKGLLPRFNQTNINTPEGTSSFDRLEVISADKWYRVEMRLVDPNLPLPISYFIYRLSVRFERLPV